MAPGISDLTRRLKEILRVLIDNYLQKFPDRQAWVEVQLARLNLWAASIGVFAQDDLNIEARLKKRKDIKDTIIVLLQALIENSREYYRVITGKRQLEVGFDIDKLIFADLSDADSDSESVIDQGSKSKTDPVVPNSEDLIKLHMKHLDRDLSRLNQYALQLRRDAPKRNAAKAKDFQPPDLKDFDDHIKCIVKRDMPSAEPLSNAPQDFKPEEKFIPDEYLKTRVHETMLFRWRRICYQRYHAKHLADQSDVNIEAAKPKPKVPISDMKLTKDNLKRTESKPREVLKPPVALPVQTALRAPSAATTLATNFQLNQNEDAPKARSATTKVGGGTLSFPQYPELKPGVDVFICPICNLPVQVNDVPKKKWHSHVLKDLQSFICLAKDCSKSTDTYSSLEQWASHMRSTHPRYGWTCNICKHNGDLKFDTEEKYRQHLEATHGDQASDQKIVDLLVKNTRQEFMMHYEQCIFCGFQPEFHVKQKSLASAACQADLIDHMSKRHMRYFALSSLPYDIAADDKEVSGRITKSVDESIDRRKEELKDSNVFRKADDDRRAKESSFIQHLTAAEEEALKKDPTLRRFLTGESSQATKTMAQIKEQYSTDEDEHDDPTCQAIVRPWLELLADQFETIDENAVKIVDSAPVLKEVDSVRRSSVAAKVMLEQSPTSPVFPPGLQKSRTADFEDSDDKETSPDDGEGGNVEQSQDEADKMLAKAWSSHGNEDIYKFCRSNDAVQLRIFLSIMKNFEEGFYLKDLYGFSPWHHAIEGDSLECLDVLMKEELPLFNDRFGVSPLCYAMFRQRSRLVGPLLEYGQRIANDDESENVSIEELDTSVPDTWSSAFIIACLVGDLQGVKHMLRKDTDLSTRFKHDHPRYLSYRNLISDCFDVQEHEIWSTIMSCSVAAAPLYFASSGGYDEIVQLLVDHGAELEQEATRFESDGDWNRTAIQQACRTDCPSTVNLLLKLGASVTYVVSDHTAGTLAICAASLRCLKIVIESITDTELRKDGLSRALLTSAEEKNVDCLKYLLEQDAPTDRLDPEGDTPLSLFVIGGCLEGVELLLKANKSLIDVPGEDGHTPLIWAAQRNQRDILKLLLENGAAINHQIKTGGSALMFASTVDDTVCLKALLEQKADMTLTNDYGNTAFHDACMEGKAPHVKLLLEHGADIEQEGEYGQRPLMMAACVGNLEVITFLVENGAEIDAQSGQHKVSALICASYSAKPDIIKYLVEYKNKPNLELEDNDKITALGHALSPQNHEMMEILLNAGAKIPIHYSKYLNKSLLDRTLAYSRPTHMRLLLQAGASPLEDEDFYEPALIFAAKHGDQDLIRLLLEKTNIDPTDNYDRTPLIVATNYSNFGCVKLLLANKANVHHKDEDGNTALHMACNYCNLDIIELLIKNGAQPNCINGSGQTPLMKIAMTSTNIETKACIDALIAAGADMHRADFAGYKAVVLAAAGGTEETLGLLLDIVKNPDSTTPDGQTLLMVAATAGSQAKVELLLERGASLEYTDSFGGWSALSVSLACMQCNVSRIFLEHNATIDVEKLSGPALRAVRLGLKEIRNCPNGASHREILKEMYWKVSARWTDAMYQTRDLSAILDPIRLDRLRLTAKNARDRARAKQRVDRPRVKQRASGSVKFAEEPELIKGKQRLDIVEELARMPVAERKTRSLTFEEPQIIKDKADRLRKEAMEAESLAADRKKDDVAKEAGDSEKAEDAD